MFPGFNTIKHNFDDQQKISLSIKHILFSKSRGTSRCICQKASLTVEAAVILPFFVCFMVFVLYFFRILQVQADIAQVLQYTGRKIAAEYSTHVDAGNTDAGNMNAGNTDTEHNGTGKDFAGLLKARVIFQKQLKKQNCPVQYISGKTTGISLMQSDFSGNYVELKAVYQMKLPIGLFGKIKYRIVQVSKCRKWTGYQPGQDAQETDTWLYYTEYGTVYHTSRSCSHLDLSIQGIPYQHIGQNRNHSGGKYHKCEKCGSSSAGRGMVYITNYGDRYHNSLTCSGLKRSIYMIRKSEASNEKKMCSKCGK